MNRVTALGVPVGVELRESRNGVLYATGALAYRAGGRFARVPLVGFGILAERLHALQGVPTVLGGYLQEYQDEGMRRMQVVVQEAFGVERETFTAPLGHPVVDGYARAEVSGIVAQDPTPLVGAVGLRVAVRYPMGTRHGETFVPLVVLGGKVEEWEKGDRIFAEGGLVARKDRPERVDLLVGRIEKARREVV